MTAVSPSRVLAVDGGMPVRARPVSGWPRFDGDDLASVREVLLSGRVNYWTGEHGRLFEAEFARWAGARHGVAVGNGTLALELALAALGIGPGDDVVVPAATFIATASAVAARGATPVVADVSLGHRCLTPASIEAALTPRTRAVVVVHLAGYPVDMPPIVRLARAHGLRVVEDCAQAHGARRHGRMVGTDGDIAAWSFCQDKIITTAGEGGAVTTDDEDLWRRVWEAKDHGKSHAEVFAGTRSPGFRWVHDSFGTNARMTEIQAVVGRNQLRKVDGWLAARRAHADALREALADLPALALPDEPPGARHAWYRFTPRVRPAELAPGWDRDRFVAAVAAEGVPCQQGGCTEIHRERAFDRIRPRHPLPAAAELGRTAFALLTHPTLTDEEIRDTAEAVRKVASAATRDER
ncbi:DegT/DnrJ/EryC1/StrS family aminotransferase [Pseudonocardia acaciae]|uniref:DegT/DnrJ/EryC1/StrS family aminotransferase n=1 Tax=Pseudonocardia acaciae TaxID=551276 RepID=UPI00048FDC83|nr:DegT/DnrJ/EryC1/StrS aminotransferase family protein [Pseudonocardia acaciae]